MNTRRIAWSIVGLLSVCAAAEAGVVLELVPSNPGPYFGGESLTVDVWLQSDQTTDVRLSTVQLDFSDSDSRLSLDSTFAFDFTSLPFGRNYYSDFLFPELPIPRTSNFIKCVCPGRFLLLPAKGSLHVGSLGVTLPFGSDQYVLDALNADAPDLTSGAMLALLSTETELWRAHTGEIESNGLTFNVVPEPASVSLMLVGAVFLLARRRSTHTTCGPSGLVGRVPLVGCRPGSTVSNAIVGLFLWCLISLGETAWGQRAVIPAETVAIILDSGPVTAPAEGNSPVLVFSQEVSAEGASWLRMHLTTLQLSSPPSPPCEPFLRISSVVDGAAQTINESTFSQWRQTSAYFNGDRILIQLFGCPGAGTNRVAADTVGAGLGSPVGGVANICGFVDDRVPSSDPRAARLVFFDLDFQAESLCTAFLFNDRSNCLLTAGHCCDNIDLTNTSYPPLIEFNVPPSSSNGHVNHPWPEDQYPVDPLSIQFENAALGRDYCIFGAFNNTATGLSPLKAQGRSYRLAAAAPPAYNRPLGVTGYGQDSTPTRSYIQQTATGPYEQLEGTVLKYKVDAMAGSSGSPVQAGCNGLVYAIHTNGGCDQSPIFVNHGTAVQYAALQTALANPQGVCALPQDCNNNGRDDRCDINCDATGCSASPCGTSVELQRQWDA